MRIVLVVFFLMNALFSTGQEKPEIDRFLTKNRIKVNVIGAAMQIYAVQYERHINDNWSVNNTFFYRPKKSIPFAVSVDSLAKKRGVGLTGIKFEYIYMDRAKVGVVGFSPEFRYYFGKKKNRTFVSAFGQFEQFEMLVPAALEVRYLNRTAEVILPIDFGFRTFSGGILVGRQFNWGNFGLDFVLIGPHFGISRKFNAVAQNTLIKDLSPADKGYLQNKVSERFGLTEKYFSIEIVDDKTTIKSIRNVPYFGIRGLGANVSYSF